MNRHLNALRRWKPARRCVRAAAAGLATLLTAGQAGAINIVVTFNSGSSDSPSFDSDGSKLTAIMNAAASYWEDIIQDAGTLNVEYFWDNLDDDTLGLHNNLATSGGKPTSARVRFDTLTSGGVERLWYFDTTPTNNSEYNLQQTMFRDLTGAQQTDWYNGSPPALLEVGFRGQTAAGAPAAAVNGFDLWSTAIHELGHALGLTANVLGTEDDDGDIDIPSNLVGGTVMAVEGDAHIDPRLALMCEGCGDTNLRRLPTATDIIAIAAASGWTNIDMPRQEFLTGFSWNVAGNWVGNKVPDSADDANVRNGNDIDMTANGRVENLLVDEGSGITTNGNRLTVDNTLTIGMAGTAFVTVGDLSGAGGVPELFANNIDINNGSSLTLLGTGALVDANDIDVNAGGNLLGNGRVLVDSINNNGTISGGLFLILFAGGHLTIEATAGNTLDLDGTSGDGELFATLGNLTLDGPLLDQFDGRARIIETRTMTFTDAWEMRGTLELSGSGSDAATLAGATVTISRDVDVEGDNNDITAPVIFTADAKVSVPTAGDRLDLRGTTTYNGGDFTGLGTIQQSGNSIIAANTTIDVAAFDMDGTAGNTHAMTVAAGATLTINSNQIDTVALSSDGYDGVLTLRGTLAMNTPGAWRMDGTLILDDTGPNPTVNGQEMDVFGSISLPTGTGQINAPIDFQSSAVVTVGGATSNLILNGATTYRGGSYTGVGRISQNGIATVANHTTISVATYDWDGGGASTTTINPGVTFTLNVTNIDTVDAATDGFDGTINLNSGTLAVNTPTPWRQEGLLNITNTGGGTPNINGSTMVLQDRLVVSGGNANINTAFTLESTGVVTVNAGATLFIYGVSDLMGGTMNVAGEVELNGTSTFRGGTYTGAGTIQIDNTATIANPTTIQTAVFDMDGTAGTTQLVLNAFLGLNVTNVDTGNNTYNGTTTINGFARLEVNTPVTWNMAGTMNLNTTAVLTNPVLSGQAVTISGIVNADGLPRLDAKIDLTGTINTADADTNVQLNGGLLADHNTISGGSVNGPGILSATSAHTLRGFGTINTRLSFTGTANLYADNGTLNVNNTILDVGIIGTFDADGVLNVANAWNTSIADRLELNGGRVIGATITNGGTTQGFGEIASAGFINNGTLSATGGGTLTVNTTAAPDLDGSGAETGVVNAINGNIHVPFAFTGLQSFDATLNVGAGRSFRMDSFGLFLNTDAIMNLTGGTYMAPNFTQGAQLNVSAATSTINSTTIVFNAAGDTQLDANLNLTGNATIHAGAGFSGAGSLIVTAGSTLALRDGASVPVGIVNSGTAAVGNSPGFAKVGAYRQSSNGTFVAELGGTTPATQYDQLIVSGPAQLAGHLSLDVTGTYNPRFGDALSIIEAGTLEGFFRTISGVVAPNGLGLAVLYNYNLDIVTVNPTLIGDATVDGSVGIADLSRVAVNFGRSGMTWIDGDFDGNGMVNITDLSAVALRFGQSLLAPGPISLGDGGAIPEPATAATFGAALLAIFRRRRKA